jgi:hypothetical protein
MDLPPQHLIACELYCMVMPYQRHVTRTTCHVSLLDRSNLTPTMPNLSDMWQPLVLPQHLVDIILCLVSSTNGHVAACGPATWHTHFAFCLVFLKTSNGIKFLIRGPFEVIHVSLESSRRALRHEVIFKRS